MSAPPIQVPETRWAEARGGRLAYHDFGVGGPTILAIPPLAQNIEMAWEWPDVRRMLERFASFSRYIVFDKRGTGCSDRRSYVPGIDERVDDVRAVMDAAEVSSAHFYVQSEGGPMALLFAATYPERVESLILHGTGASTAPTLPPDQDMDDLMERIEQYAAAWGTPESIVVDRMAPSMASNLEYRTWHQRYERNAATQDSLLELITISMDVDVSEVLPDLDVPSLVIHRTGDQVIPVERGRELAEKIPGARLAEFDGDDHFAYVGDITPTMDEIEKWVTGEIKTRLPASQPPTGVRIHTLGQFAVERDGEEVPTSAWGSKLARTLCKRLVAARGWPVTRDELFDLLWPDESDRGRLGARLSVQLSTVRRILGGGVIADRDTVRLDLDEVTTDLEDFWQAPSDGAIVAAYPGEFLPEDRYDDWSVATRDEARARFATAARATAEGLLTRSNYQAAAGYARRLIEADRYDEEAHRLLVLTHLRAGEMPEAKRAHDSWAAASEELGTEIPAFEDLS